MIDILNKIKYYIKYFLYITYCSLYMFLCFPLYSLISFIRNKGSIKNMKDINYHYYAKYLYKIIYLITGVKIKIEGLESIPNDKNFIVASKHETSADIAILCLTFKQYPIFLAKKQLFHTPIKYALKNNCIPVNKNSNTIKEIKELYATCIDRVKRNKTIILFPEGTRNNTLKYIKYKSGVFHIAKKTNSIVLPVAHNSSDAVGRNYFSMPKNETINIRCLPTIDPTDMDQDAFLKKLEEAININTSILHENFHKNNK